MHNLNIRESAHRQPVASFFKLGMMLCIWVVGMTNLRAQVAAPDNKPVATLTATQWKALEGVFQSAGNKDLNVQFTVRDNTLYGKLLWNNREIKLTTVSELVFISKTDEGEGGPLKIEFQRDAIGKINQVKIGNNDLWNRNYDYKPIVKIEMQHTPDQLKPFVGLYQLKNDPSRYIEFLIKENQLLLKQHWDGNLVSFVPESELSFFSKEIPMFSLEFSKGSDGNIEKALAFKRDAWQKVKLVQSSPEMLKAYEGKYQFKDDPDNLVQLIVRGSRLIVKQLWDGKETEMEQLAEFYFYNTTQSYPLVLIKDNSGNISKLLILGSDEFNRVKD